MKAVKIISILLILFSLSTFAQEEENSFGKEISITEVTKISDILADPEAYVGKTVLIEGEVLDVCKMAGCWMELQSDNEGDKIKVKVKDGEIVFPVEAVGKNALVEGTVYVIDLTEEEAREYMEHIAEEQEQEFDPSSVTGPMKIYQVKGIGAEITSAN